ncbi:hypothetical protein KR074_001490 [Drosophila pseudoananassae]|nr:hypothetical protein KR074_001490 [Drosophila pseudoananassae]
MFVLAKFCFFAILAWNLLGLSSGILDQEISSGNDTSLCVVTEPTEQCDNFCLKLLKPLTNHIELHQNKWADQDAAKLNETQQKLNQIITQLEDLQKKVQFLNKVEEYQNSTLVNIDKHIYTLMNFVRAGTRLFYISIKAEVSWSMANKLCHDVGAHLAVFLDETEMIAISNLTAKGVNYWTGLNDLNEEGKFVSTATRASDTYIKWSADHSEEINMDKNCVSLMDDEMMDHKCEETFNYICQLDAF